MKFGTTENPGSADLSLPDKPFGGETGTPVEDFAAYVGCSVWNRRHLRNFFPKDVKAELTYYSSQFNSVELNVTLNRNFADSQYVEWRDHTMTGFMFFPRLSRDITDQLRDFEEPTEEFVRKVSLLGEKLGCVFAVLGDKFEIENFDRVEAFVKHWRSRYRTPLAIELRNKDWFNNSDVSKRIFDLFEDHQITNIIVDTAGRRDLLHMRLTTPFFYGRNMFIAFFRDLLL